MDWRSIALKILRIVARLLVISALLLSASCGEMPELDGAIGSCGAIAGLKATSENQL